MFALSSQTLERTAPARRRRSLIGRVIMMLAMQDTRLRLDQLDDAQLRDIGISRDQARREAGRRIWDVPSNWQG